MSLQRPIAASQAAQRAEEALGLLHDSLMIERLGDFTVARVDERPGHQRVRMVQRVGGIEIDDANVDLHFDTTAGSADATRLIYVTGGGIPAASIEVAEPRLGEGMAKLKGKLALGQPELSWALTAKLVYTEVDTRYRLTWRIDAADASGGPSAETLWLDATGEGQLLKRANRVQADSVQAYIHPINPSAGARQWVGMPHLLLLRDGVAVGQTDASGAHSVSGTIALTKLASPIANVRSNLAQKFSYGGNANARFNLADSDPGLSEVTAFYFVNTTHDWFKNTFDYAGLDHPIDVLVHAEDCLYNAYAQNDDRLSFGDGCGVYDFAQSADVAIHEYTHLVAANISDLDYSTYSEAGAFGEGQSDYFACSLTNDPVHGENLTGIFQRRCDSDARLERDYNGEAHSGAPVYSGAMWKLRTQFGRTIADQLAFYALYYIPRHPYLIDVRDAVLQADRERFGASHQDEIRAAFDAHGINDQVQVFVSSSVWKPAPAPFKATLSAHAQGFDTRSLSFTWEFGDGGTASGEEVEHVFTKKPYTAKVTASDRTGLSQFSEVTISGCRASGSPDWAWLAAILIVAVRMRRSATR